MAHCPYEKLSALEPALNEIRKMENLKERKPGIFYFRSQSFLHFHIKGDAIWAHIKDKKTWVSYDIPSLVTKKFLTEFVSAVRNKLPAT